MEDQELLQKYKLQIKSDYYFDYHKYKTLKNVECYWLYDLINHIQYRNTYYTMLINSLRDKSKESVMELERFHFNDDYKGGHLETKIALLQKAKNRIKHFTDSGLYYDISYEEQELDVYDSGWDSVIDVPGVIIYAKQYSNSTSLTEHEKGLINSIKLEEEKIADIIKTIVWRSENAIN